MRCCLLLAALTACTGADLPETSEVPAATPSPTPTPVEEPPVEARVRLQGVELPTALGDRLQLHVSKGLTVDGNEHALGWGKLGSPPGEGEACQDVDLGALLPAGAGAMLAAQGPCGPAPLTLGGLEIGEDGALTTGARSEGFSLAGAGRGELTPWGTYLVGQRDGGWVHELSLAGAEGGRRLVPHRALGRIAQRAVLAMPDRTSVYLVGGGADAALYLFVAAQEGDLSRGTLHAMRWTLREEPGEVIADLHWVPLGPGSDGEVDAVAAREPSAESIFVSSPVGPDGACPAGAFSGPDGGCVVVRAGQELAASRLFTERLAGLAGASLGLGTLGSVVYVREQGVLYLSLTPNPSAADKLGAAGGACGVVLALALEAGVRDTRGGILPTEFAATTARIALTGAEQRYAAPGMEDNRCDVERIAHPDGLAFLRGYDMLLVGESAGGHANPALWGWPVGGGAPTRLLTTPQCAELGALHWAGNLGGRGYLGFTVRHPYVGPGCAGTPDFTPPAGFDRSWFGYLGPFPTLGEPAAEDLPSEGRGLPLGPR
jgi:hypothetical protein